MLGRMLRRFDVDLQPFDPADYLDSEEGTAAYLADARADGAVALSRAVEVEVVARARARLAQNDAARLPSSPGENRRRAS